MGVDTQPSKSKNRSCILGGTKVWEKEKKTILKEKQICMSMYSMPGIYMNVIVSSSQQLYELGIIIIILPICR